MASANVFASESDSVQPPTVLSACTVFDFMRFEFRFQGCRLFVFFNKHITTLHSWSYRYTIVS